MKKNPSVNITSLVYTLTKQLPMVFIAKKRDSKKIIIYIYIVTTFKYPIFISISSTIAICHPIIQKVY